MAFSFSLPPTEYFLSRSLSFARQGQGASSSSGRVVEGVSHAALRSRTRQSGLNTHPVIRYVSFTKLFNYNQVVWFPYLEHNCRVLVDFK